MREKSTYNHNIMLCRLVYIGNCTKGLYVWTSGIHAFQAIKTQSINWYKKENRFLCIADKLRETGCLGLCY